MARCKLVVSAEPTHVREVEALVEQERYSSVSEFVREAMDLRLESLRRTRLAEQVARYCADGHASEDDDLVAAQAFPGRDE